VEISPEKYPLFISRYILIAHMSILPPRYWKMIFGFSLIITILSLLSLPSLYENISGDSIPNVSQKGPPIEYKWDTAIIRIVIAVIFSAVSTYAYNQIRK
jgi:hypothetical protein